MSRMIGRKRRSTKPLMDYLIDCYEREDWHGVSDAANDLRELEATNRAWLAMTKDENDERG